MMIKKFCLYYVNEKFVRLFFLSFFKEKNSLLDELETTRNQYSECHQELLRLQELLERIQSEKSKLGRRITKLVHNGNQQFRDDSREGETKGMNLFFCFRKRSSPRITKMSSNNKTFDSISLRWFPIEKTFLFHSTRYSF